MQYSPKLKIAAEEIKAILEKHDIAGVVVLHSPGYGEFVMRIDPSYSCAKIERGKLLLNNAHLPDQAQKLKSVADTANMLTIMRRACSDMAGACARAMDMMAKKFEVKNTDGGMTSQDSLSN